MRQAYSKNFFTKGEESQIIQAIQKAEGATSGEVRVHLARQIKGDPLKEAIKLFRRLGMHKTKQRNGCLILIGLKNKKVAVIGDKGINDLVGNNFWDDVIRHMVDSFKKDDYAQGLSEAILMVGKKLKQYFLYQNGDINELPDEISKGD